MMEERMMEERMMEEELTRRFGEDAEAGYIYRRGGFGVENAAGHERYRYADEEGFDREEEAYERGERAGGTATSLPICREIVATVKNDYHPM